ncbi:unnamed protein product [Orchesella dallaii]|uniref:Uncharacterized protein n=1 Tax=Orchesella dallaii TaxID=48710 RepID=A0ABP1RD27_9HEXA
MKPNIEARNGVHHATSEENATNYFNKVRRRHRTEEDKDENKSIQSLYHHPNLESSLLAAGMERHVSDPGPPVVVEDTDEDWYTSDDAATDDEEVAFQQSLYHESFYETPKTRRRRHLEIRNSGRIPTLHYAGSHKTHFWQRYGITPDEVIQRGTLKGIHTIFSEDEFNQLGPTEKRIHVNGQKFKIVANEVLQGSLYSAIAQAIASPDEEFIQYRIFDELDRRKAMFINNIFEYCEIHSLYVDDSFRNHQKVIEKYKQHRRKTGYSAPELELVAAAIHFGFTYAIVELETTDKPVVVRNCQDLTVQQKATAKYHFLKTGDSEETICYEFLLPIGKVYNPKIGPIQVGFALDHRIFLHRSTVAHDLWSLLAELIFKKLVYAPQIKQKILDSKHNFAVYYYASKAKKRYQLYGNASIQKIADGFNRRFSFEHPRGDLEDLAQAASVFNFSYTVIGMDSMGNFFWRDSVVNQDMRKNYRSPYLAFFVKTMPDRMMFWYSLEDPGRDCPKERRLYQHVMAGDLTSWNGTFYYHYAPQEIPPVPGMYLSNRTLSMIVVQNKKVKFPSG